MSVAKMVTNQPIKQKTKQDRDKAAWQYCLFIEPLVTRGVNKLLKFAALVIFQVINAHFINKHLRSIYNAPEVSCM